MTETAVRLDGVTRSFGAVHAIQGIDLTIQTGQTVALLGPDGAGKSTLIAMMLGLIAPNAGTISVYGHHPGTAMAAGQVGAMLQDAGFVANATVHELIELARALYPKPLPTKQIIATVGLTELAGRRLDKLSGGEAQLARFALALAGDPDLLILDEPTAAMDVAARQSFWAAMRRFSGAGRTVLFATGHLEEAADFADRVVGIAAGRVVADGTAAEIRKVTGGRIIRFAVEGRSIAGLTAPPWVTAVEIRGRRAFPTADPFAGTDDPNSSTVKLGQ